MAGRRVLGIHLSCMTYNSAIMMGQTVRIRVSMFPDPSDLRRNTANDALKIAMLDMLCLQERVCQQGITMGQSQTRTSDGALERMSSTTFVQGFPSILPDSQTF